MKRNMNDRMEREGRHDESNYTHIGLYTPLIYLHLRRRRRLQR